MYLKSLELVGFKSFAKKTALDFNTPITGIVGPNGSGKSNVAEAFRFVLGEQSIKSLRGKKTEDLIFNGSEEMGRLSRAGVKVVFDNSKRLLNIDFDEVSIERVIYRDSSSEYYINGSQVRLKDIVELLVGAHIGSSGHHIISQGEADRILNANLKERREMIEDALGLKIYQYKKNESERKLEKTEENIKQVESLRREIAPHIKFLQKQVEKIEKALEMKENLKNLYAEYLKREDIYLKLARTRLQEETRNPRSELARLDKEMSEAKATLSKSKEKDKKSDELISCEEELKRIRENKETLTRDIGRLEGEIFGLERIIKKQKELAGSDTDRPVPFSVVSEFSSAVNDELREAETADGAALKIIFGKIKALLGSFMAKLKSGTDMGAEETEKEMKELSQKRGEILKKKENTEKEESKALSAYNYLKEEIEKEKDSSRDAEKAFFRIMAEQNEIRAKLQIVEAEERTLAVEEGNWKRELEEGAALVGRAIYDYERAVVTEAQVFSENRQAQEERRRTIERIKLRLEDAGVGGGDDVMKEYKEATDRDQFLECELADLLKSAESLKGLIAELDMRLDVEFKEGVKKINTEFQNFFTLMFGGGQASLAVVCPEKKKKQEDDDESLESVAEMPPEETEEEKEGIDISVNLPRKKIKGLMMLSGGERALTSIALLFAVSQVNPPPLIILDETDAALDEANSRKYGDMVENLSKHSQLILITHNRETMSRAGVLYGVTMGSGGVSKLLSVRFEEAVVVAK